MTVEENILKKATQKRLLNEVAIEGGKFTTASLKQVRSQQRKTACIFIRKFHLELNISRVILN